MNKNFQSIVNSSSCSSSFSCTPQVFCVPFLLLPFNLYSLKKNHPLYSLSFSHGSLALGCVTRCSRSSSMRMCVSVFCSVYVQEFTWQVPKRSPLLNLHQMPFFHPNSSHCKDRERLASHLFLSLLPSLLSFI